MEIIQAAASELLVNLALGVITLLGAYGMYLIQKAAVQVQAQTAQIKDEAGRKLLTAALEDVENLATITVGAIEQTTAAALREAIKTGSGTREELVALGKQAFEDIKAKITPEAQSVITANLGSFDDYLTKLIETKVLEIKASTSF